MTSLTAIARPLSDEHHSYYSTYVDRVTGDVFAFMNTTHAALNALVGALSEAQAEARPAAGEWSIKEIIGHLSDSERVFAYRALRFARNDATPLASFDQDAYVPAGDFNTRPLRDVLQEYDTVRVATTALFASCSPDALLRRGEASGKVMSVRALLYIVAGHEDHHLASIRTVYLHMPG